MSPNRHYCPPERRKFVLIAAILASAMGFIDFSVVAVALPQMREALDADFVQAQWFSNAYMLFLSALILIGGALGDRFGVKPVLALGMGLFVLASLACAMAWNAESLIVFRALKGVGAAIMIPGSMAIISINTPRAERGRALGIWVSASAITTSLGPLLGSLMIAHGGDLGWRLIFAINLPIGLIALYLLLRFVPRDAAKHAGGLLSIDWIGGILLTGALGLIALGLSGLGETGSKAAALNWFIGGVALALAGLVWEWRHRDPMINLRLFSSPAFSGGNVLTFLVWAGVGAINFFLPMLLITAWQLPATYAGAAFIPFSVPIALMSPLTGRLVDRYGTRIFLTIGPLVVTLGFLAVAWAVYVQDYWFGVLPAMVLFGIGMGLTASPISTAVMNAVDDEHTGTASGINNMMARMSNLFGVAGGGALLSMVYAAVVLAGDLDADIAQLMVQAGFGERLTGGLYQVSTQSLQLVLCERCTLEHRLQSQQIAEVWDLRQS